MKIRRKPFGMVAILIGLVGLVLFTSLQAQEIGCELIADPHFQNGFVLLEPKPGKRVAYGAITETGAVARPSWDLGQWSSKYPLKTEAAKRLADGVLSFTNVGKRVCVGATGTAKADLSLGVNASAEYGDRARKSQAEPWVHLLAQQEIANPPSLTELAHCPFHAEVRLIHSLLYQTNQYNPSLHAAQFTIYLTVANRNQNSPGYGQYYWFGIPVYDNRSRIAPSFQARDFGGTAMFIYNLSSDVLAKESTHDGQWVTFAGDLLPLMREGLEAGWKRGFMPGSTEFSDYRVTGIFLGWELPGIFDVELQLRNLSLVAIPAGSKGR